MLPRWWTRKGSQTRLKARAHVKSPKLQGGSGMSLESIVTFDWQLALGDETISHGELEALGHLKAPLGRLRARGGEGDSAESQAALAFLEKKAYGTTTRGAVA